jgi:peptidoglycan/LPS O-acetylase OafA/YrhL
VLSISLATICCDAWFGWRRHFGMLHSYPTTVFGLSAYAIFFVCLIALCFRPGPVRSFFNLAALRGAGKISYGIYIYHVLFMPFYYWIVARMLPHASHNATEGVIFVVALVGTLLIASASFYGFESRVSRLKRFFPSQTRLPEQALEESRPEVTA